MSNARELAELGGSYGTGGFVGMKNRLINSDMRIDQRNAGASVTPTTGTYTLDRWTTENNQSSKFSVQQNAGSVTPPVGFTKYLGITSLSAYSAGATDYFLLSQFIEGLNVADLAWGTANAKAVTLSFQVYSSLTGTFGGTIANSANDRIYPFTYTISAANTWTSISVTIAGDTTGTWLTTNGVGIKVRFGFGVGSTYSGTAGSWGSSFVLSATGATSVVGTSGATFYITGVQLEKGSTATSFDYRPYGTELALCQRYFNQVTATEAYNCFANGFQMSTTQAHFSYTFSINMRARPTITASNLGVSDATSFTNAATLTSTVASTTTSRLIFNYTAAGAQFRGCALLDNNNVNGYLQFSAEL